MRRLYFVVCLFAFFLVKCQLLFILQLLDVCFVFLFFYTLCLCLLFVAFFCLGTLAWDNIIKWVKNNFGFAYVGRVSGPVIVVCVQTLEGEQVEYRIAHNFPENGVFFVEVRALSEGDEELRSVAVFIAVGHCDHASPTEL